MCLYPPFNGPTKQTSFEMKTPRYVLVRDGVIQLEPFEMKVSPNVFIWDGVIQFGPFKMKDPLDVLV
jgi:hypothetical protein